MRLTFLTMCLMAAGVCPASEAPPVLAAGVEKVEAICTGGRTYVTFRKANEADVSYAVYRLASLPADVVTLKPVAVVAAVTHLHPDCKVAFVMPGGQELTTADGLFVYAPKAKEKVWYAVLPQGVAGPLKAGVNLTAAVVDEAPAEHPAAVFQAQKTKYAQVEDHYALWMDYEEWQKDPSVGQWRDKTPEYYGSFFSISYLKGANEGEKVPLEMSLHAISGGGAGDPFALTALKGVYRMYVEDHRRRWWDGKSGARIEAQMDFLLGCDKYRIDPDRVYVTGISMGGCGTLVHSLGWPGKYAAAYAMVPRTQPKFVEQVSVEKDLPPLALYFSWKDGVEFNAKAQGPLIRKMQESKQGCWVTWADEGHVVAKTCTAENCVPGGFHRFRRNELFPVFLHTSSDDNCGQKDVGDVVTAGQINQTIDWGSSLHPLPLANSAIVDEAEELSITFKATVDCTTDLAVRRAQAFRPAPGAKLVYRNVTVADGKVLLEGEMVVPTDGVWVIKGAKMTATGNRIAVRAVSGR